MLTIEVWPISRNERLVVCPAFTHKLAIRQPVVQGNNPPLESTVIFGLRFRADVWICVRKARYFRKVDWLGRTRHDHQESERV